MANEKTPLYQTVKDTVSLELTKPVLSRVKDRIKELKKLSEATHEKRMRGNVVIWHTKSPDMFISNLQPSIENGVGIITYSKFKMDGKNKAIERIKSKMPNSEKEVETHCVYVYDCTVIETIEKNKPMRVQELRDDNDN